MHLSVLERVTLGYTDVTSPSIRSRPATCYSDSGRRIEMVEWAQQSRRYPKYVTLPVLARPPGTSPPNHGGPCCHAVHFPGVQHIQILVIRLLGTG
jgi:hypothetical protein